MTIRTSITGAEWTQIGTGPATVQMISSDAAGVVAMVQASASAPSTNSGEGMAMGPAFPVHHFTLAEPIWAQVVNATETAVFAVQPEAS